MGPTGGTGIALILATLLVAWEPAVAERQIRYLNFTVKSEFDFYVRDLKSSEVRLEVDGKQLEVGFLGASDTPTAYCFVLENSPRTAPYFISRPGYGQINPLDQVRYQMLDDFFRPLLAGGRAMLAQFYREFEVLQRFTEEDQYLVNALNDMRPDSLGLVLDDIEVGRALGRGVDFLRDQPERRKVLFLFTKTVDRQSYQNLEEYQSMLRHADIDLFILSFAPRVETSSAAAFEEKMNTYFFRHLVSETSGWAYISGEYWYVDEMFTDLKGRLQNTYTIGFYVEPEQKVRQREVKIRTSRRNAEVTHRKYLIY